MKNSLFPSVISALPEWAKYFAWVELDSDIKIQIMALKYPNWEDSFYPVYLDKNNRPLFDFPLDLSTAANDGRLWRNCPAIIFYSPRTSQIAVDKKIESDHPRSARAERRIISPPEFKGEIVESVRADYGKNLNNPAGDIIPKLTALGDDFQERRVIFLNEKDLPNERQSPQWSIEKVRIRKSKKKT